MIEKFLREHIDFLIEDANENGKKYDIKEEDYKDIINDIINDEYLWEHINIAVLNKLEKYEED